MGWFGKKKSNESYSSFEENSYDFRSDEEKRIEKNASQPLSRDLEAYVEDILGAFARDEFDQYDQSKIVYWDKSDNSLKGPLRKKAENIGNLKDLQRVYYRVVHLARDRRMNIVERYMSVLFDRIDGWMD